MIFKTKAELENYKEILEREIKNLNNLLLDIKSPGFVFFLGEIQKDYNKVNSEINNLVNSMDSTDKIGLKSIKLIVQKNLLQQILDTEKKTRMHKNELVKRLETVDTLKK